MPYAGEVEGREEPPSLIRAWWSEMVRIRRGWREQVVVGIVVWEGKVGWGAGGGEEVGGEKSTEV